MRSFSLGDPVRNTGDAAPAALESLRNAGGAAVQCFLHGRTRLHAIPSAPASSLGSLSPFCACVALRVSLTCVLALPCQDDNARTTTAAATGRNTQAQPSSASSMRMRVPSFADSRAGTARSRAAAHTAVSHDTLLLVLRLLPARPTCPADATIRKHSHHLRLNAHARPFFC